MAYQHQGSCASAGDTLELLAFDDEFDPLAVDDSEIDQEWMDDENPYDTIDYPTMRNMPETVHHDPVYSPARQGSATEALQALIVRNPNRRPVLLNIIGLCEGGCDTAHDEYLHGEGRHGQRSSSRRREQRRGMIAHILHARRERPRL